MLVADKTSAEISWPLVAFEKVAIAQSDRGQRLKQRDYLAEGLIPVIDQGQALVGGYTDDENASFVGDLPVVLFGDHTRAVKLIHHRFAVGADGIKIFRPAEGVRAKYLYYWMKSARIPDRGYGRHYQYLRALSVPLPPEAHQDEIVAAIEKQFSRLDEAVANLQRVKANLKRYKASVLKDAVEGRSFETGEQLLQRVLEERRAKWTGKGKYKEPVRAELNVHPLPPDGWAHVSWETVLSPADGAFKRGPFGSALTKAIFVSAGYKVYEQYCPINDDCSFTRYYITPEKFEELKGFAVQPGDYLISCSGVTLGRITRLPEKFEPGVINQALLRVRLNSSVINHRFFLHVFRGPVFQSQIFAQSAGAAIPNVRGVNELKAMPIPLPPLAEQQLIADEVDRQLSIIREVEAEVSVNLQRAQALRQATLAKAFSNR